MGPLMFDKRTGAGPRRGGCMSSTHPVSLDDYQERVEGMIEAGELFGVVEDTINAATLVEDQKAALWLLAWSSRDSSAQRRDEIAALELVSNC
jgi:hypothetical protein